MADLRAESQPATFGTSYRRYVVLLLLAIGTTNLADRQILGILTPLIKAEFVLSDASLGLLSGFAFAIFYATLGIPVAMWADRGSRKLILVLAVTVWSGMTAICGLAQGFWQLALARVGVGIGEAGGTPPSHSLIADLYPFRSRATALAVFSLSVPLGLFFGNLLGGQVAAAHGWRAGFFVVGIPGLLLALVALLTLREPPRGLADGSAGGKSEAPPLLSTVHFMWSQRSLRHLMVGSTLAALVGYATLQWTASFLIRSHGMSLGATAVYLALAAGGAGGLGTFVGGWASDRLGRADIRWASWIVGVALAVAVPVTIVISLTDSGAVARTLIPLSMFVAAVSLGPTSALNQALVAVRMRTVAASLLLFVNTFFGLGIGPWLVGAVSDSLAPRFGDHALRYALMLLALFSLWAAIHYFMAGRTLAAGLERTRRMQS